MSVEIISAEYDHWGNILVVFEGQKPDTVIAVPPDPENRDYIALQEWAAKEGNEIKAYLAPPPPPPQPSVQDLMARIEELEAKVITPEVTNAAD